MTGLVENIIKDLSQIGQLFTTYKNMSRLRKTKDLKEIFLESSLKMSQLSSEWATYNLCWYATKILLNSSIESIFEQNTVVTETKDILSLSF